MKEVYFNAEGKKGKFSPSINCNNSIHIYFYKFQFIFSWVLEIFNERVQRTTRLHEASTNTLLSPPPNPPPSLASLVWDLSPPSTLVVEPLIEGFDSVWQRWREEIWAYNEKYFDSQDRGLCGLQSSCEELKKDDFDRGDMKLWNWGVWKIYGGMKSA